jgi:hypothetical protein
LHWGPLEWHYLPTIFHENLPSGSKLLVGYRQTGDLISLVSFLESRLIVLKTCVLLYVKVTFYICNCFGTQILVYYPNSCHFSYYPSFSFIEMTVFVNIKNCKYYYDGDHPPHYFPVTIKASKQSIAQ